MSIFDREPDRTWRNNDTDGRTFYGFDDDDGTTAWYDENGNLDDVSDTPSDWDQERNDEGY